MFRRDIRGLLRKNTFKFVFKLILFSMFLLSHLVSFTQGEWNNWYFGYKAGITFKYNPPFALTNSRMYQSGNCPATCSDSAGNLLFYSSGNKIYDRNHNIMPNGLNLFGGLNGAQPVFIIKKPGVDSIYYLFTIGDNSWFFTGLNYSLVDLHLNGGFGAIPTGIENLPLSGVVDSRSSLTATRHRNNKDIWLLTSKFDNGHQYASILISDSGISNFPIISPSLLNYTSVQTTGMGRIKISQDGTKMICWGGGIDDKWAELCNFNTVTGKVQPLFKFRPVRNLDTVIVTGGYEFSHDSKYLYAIGSKNYGPGIDSSFLFQFDPSRESLMDFMNSQIFIGDYGNSTVQNNLQLGPDNKRYGSHGTDSTLNIIQNPSMQGLFCGFQQSGINLTMNHNGGPLPQFIQNYYVYVNYQNQCKGDTVQFTSVIWPPADTIEWNFGDYISGSYNYSTSANPLHYYSTPGSYTVSLYVRHTDNRRDTVWKTVNIYAYPTPNLGLDRSICIGDSVTFDAGNCDGCNYSWSNLSTNQMNIAARLIKPASPEFIKLM